MRRLRGVSGGTTRYRLTPQQLSMLASVGTNDSHYVLKDLLRVTGDVKPEGVLDALRGLPQRHAVLRGAVSGDTAVLRPLTEVLELACRGVDAMTLQGMQQWFAAPFDLTSEPPLRTGVVRLSPTELAIGLCTHHIASDGWSQGLLLREVAQRIRTGAPDPRSAVQYWDASERNRAHGGGAETQAIRSDDVPALANLWSGSVGLLGDVSISRFEVDLPTGAAERRQAQGVTWYSSLAACTLMALGAVLDDARVAVGSPFGGRVDPIAVEAVGYFSNTILIDTTLTSRTTLPTLAATVQRTVRISYQTLVRDWTEVHDPEVFAVRFTCGTDQPSSGELAFGPGSTCTSETLPSDARGKRPLSIHCTIANGRLTVAVERRIDMVSRRVADELGEAIVHVVQGL